jgi:hypothetical protein
MIFELILFFLILISGFTLSKYFSNEKKDVKRLRALWLYHLFFSVAYSYLTTQDTSSDSLKYWRVAKTISGSQALEFLFQERGTLAMYALNYFPSAVLDLSYLSLSTIYALFGFIGICFFYRIASEVIPQNSKVGSVYLFPTIFFLPTLHFWSSGVGKDTLLFTCVGGFVYALMKINRRYILLLLSIGASYFVRPHITVYLLLSFALAYLVNTKIQLYKRVLLSLLLLGASVVILPKLMEFAKIEELSLDSYSKFAEQKAEILSRANVGSRVDMSNYPLPLKVFTFLYRPLFFDINSIPSLLASIENLFLLFLSYKVIRNSPVKVFKSSPYIIKGLFFFLILGATISSMSLGNLGIMIRMRNMFLPAMLIYILWAYSYQTQRALKERNRLIANKKQAALANTAA